MGWPDRYGAAISLSFDDARASQLRVGVPLFERLGVPVTFFVLCDAVAQDRAGWLDALARGHEIGNHTLTHPCSANFAWTRENSLERMTVADFALEVSEANRQLRALLDIEPTVFAYPCGETFVGRGTRTKSLVPLIAASFKAGRTFNDITANSPADVDLAQSRCVNSDQRTLNDLLPLLEATVADGAWLILGGHEIGPADQVGEVTWIETIEAVVSWCRRNQVWVQTIGNVAQAVEALRRERPVSRWGGSPAAASGPNR